MSARVTVGRHARDIGLCVACVLLAANLVTYFVYVDRQGSKGGPAEPADTELRADVKRLQEENRSLAAKNSDLVEKNQELSRGLDPDALSDNPRTGTPNWYAARYGPLMSVPSCKFYEADMDSFFKNKEGVRLHIDSVVVLETGETVPVISRPVRYRGPDTLKHHVICFLGDPSPEADGKDGTTTEPFIVCPIGESDPGTVRGIALMGQHLMYIEADRWTCKYAILQRGE